MTSAQVPIVTICCTAFNHEAYLRDAIEGFLKQDFSRTMEIIVHDDASTDGTAAIIAEYSRKHPGLIQPILQKENQFSRGVKIWATQLFPRARGRYIALCEGDDFWTDPLKLSRQVEFLERHPDFIMTSGAYARWDMRTNDRRDIVTIPAGKEIRDGGYEFTLDDLKSAWITKTLTLVFRNEKEIFSRLLQYETGRDVNLIYHLLKDGRKGFYFTDILGVYRVHEQGIFGAKDEGAKRLTQYRNYRDLFRKNRDEFTRAKYLFFTLRLLNHSWFIDRGTDPRMGRLRLLFQALLLIRRPREIRQLISVLTAPLL